MNRQTTILAALGLLLLVVLFYLFGWKPQSEELARIEAETDSAITQQSTLEAEIASLEAIRAAAPDVEAALATAESLVPREASLPAALRQLQLAADDSGVELASIAAGRPVADVAVPELARFSLSINADGSYFQLIDFFRRLEDPAITPRIVLIENVAISAGEYPTLSAAMTGAMFAILPAPPVVEPTEPVTPLPTEGATEGATEEAAA